MARKSSKDVTEAELTILQAIWEHGPATIRQLAERVYGEGGASTYATVQKLLDRLESKGTCSATGARASTCFGRRPTATS